MDVDPIAHAAKRCPRQDWPAGAFVLRLRWAPSYTGARLCRASAIRLRAQRREVLPNISASLRSESGWPSLRRWHGRRPPRRRRCRSRRCWHQPQAASREPGPRGPRLVHAVRMVRCRDQDRSGTLRPAPVRGSATAAGTGNSGCLRWRARSPMTCPYRFTGPASAAGPARSTGRCRHGPPSGGGGPPLVRGPARRLLRSG